MQALTLPARRGVRWLVEGFAIFQAKPAPLCFLVLGYWLTMAVVSAIPVVGRWASFLLIPAFSVSLMNACRLIDRKGPLPRQLLFSGFHRNLRMLLVLGAVYALIMLLVSGVSMSSGFGVPLDVPAADEASVGEAPAGEAPVDQAPGQILLVSPFAVALLVPVSLVFNFAPVLVAWHDMSAGKSLFFSLVACLRNWRPFLLYLLSLLTVTLAGVCVLFMIGNLLGNGAGLPMVMAIVATSLILLPVWHASFYISYRDIFIGMQDAS
jgi:hypothetical protein